jgi:hypothetical protein
MVQVGSIWSNNLLSIHVHRFSYPLIQTNSNDRLKLRERVIANKLNLARMDIVLI